MPERIVKAPPMKNAAGCKPGGIFILAPVGDQP